METRKTGTVALVVVLIVSASHADRLVGPESRHLKARHRPALWLNSFMSLMTQAMERMHKDMTTALAAILIATSPP